VLTPAVALPGLRGGGTCRRAATDVAKVLGPPGRKFHRDRDALLRSGSCKSWLCDFWQIRQFAYTEKDCGHHLRQQSSVTIWNSFKTTIDHRGSQFKGITIVLGTFSELLSFIM
jgi:hypothetical protein